MARWITRKRSKGGRSRKTAYQLAEGFTCPPDCQKQADSRTVYEQKQAGSRTPKRSDSHPGNRRSGPVLDVGIGEGGEEEGELLCIGGCGQPARHGCSTCWEHARLELTQ